MCPIFSCFAENKTSYGCAYFIFLIYLIVVKSLKFSKGNITPYIFVWIWEQDYDKGVEGIY